MEQHGKRLPLGSWMGEKRQKWVLSQESNGFDRHWNYMHHWARIRCVYDRWSHTRQSWNLHRRDPHWLIY